MSNVNNNDKRVEQSRYDSKAQAIPLAQYRDIILRQSLEDFSPFLHESFHYYYACLLAHISPSAKILELGAGCGRHTYPLANSRLPVTASDISQQSLSVLSYVYSAFPNVSTLQCDLDNLPFEDDTFDLVCSAGCLSYGDNRLVHDNVFRILKPGGVFVCIDSLNFNPIYRFNRFIHYLRGHRSLSTLRRMPSLKLLNQYKKSSSSFSIRFFGIVAFFYPIISRLVGHRAACSVLSSIDRIIFLKYFAFKFVFTATK
jgi:ubiquinone/menaquinone biosynthesis C-methylase UbiE